MIVIPHDQLQGMLSWWKLQHGLCLACTKMQIISIRWNGFIKWRKVSINDQMMMTGCRHIDTFRRYAHMP